MHASKIAFHTLTRVSLRQAGGFGGQEPPGRRGLGWGNDSKVEPLMEDSPRKGQKTRFEKGTDAARAGLKTAQHAIANLMIMPGGDFENTVPTSCNLLFGGFSRRSILRR